MVSISTSALLVLGVAHGVEQPFWGCGMMGDLSHGIKADASTTPAMQTVIDGLKVTNTYNGKVSFWNWNYAPQDNDATTSGGHQYLTKDFVFMPENWGVGEVNASYVRQANAVNFKDGNGITCPATMGDIFLGANEPDIYGSCMGDMMGACTAPCTPGEAAAGDCPEAHLSKPQGSAKPNANGHCNCYSASQATGVGFWPVPGVTNVYQPLPTCWENGLCIDSIMGSWQKSSATVAAKGYKYLSSPLVAVNLNWTKSFVTAACKTCKDISCGCPSHIAWHFYANDCQPEKGGYANFQEKLDMTVQLMEEFPHLQGAIVNEVGMLNCAMNTPDAICIPNGKDQKYPALSQVNHTCPPTASMPKGLGSFIEELLNRVSKAKTKDGRRAVVSFTWFNLDMSGGTYNLRMFNDDGTLNQIGESYISACQAWAKDSPEAMSEPVTAPKAAIIV